MKNRSLNKCPQCGRIFYVPQTDIWAYQLTRKQEDIFLCSWSCLRAYESKHPPRSRIENSIWFNYLR